MITDQFLRRHTGPRTEELDKMLEKTGVSGIDELIDKTIPSTIRLASELNLPEEMNEYDYLKYIKQIASQNKIYKSYIGLGFYNTKMPPAIVRNILENPSWYTSYTPYQAEISQGRLETLLNYQTMVLDITGMEITNASLLDEASAAADAMMMIYNSRTKEQKTNNANVFLVDSNSFPHIADVIKTRSGPLNITVKVIDYNDFEFTPDVFGVFVQYPSADGSVNDYRSLVAKAHEKGSAIIVGADLLSLTLLTPPGEWGADVVTGSTQRFGLAMGFGGPHSSFFATREQYKRAMPGRIIGTSVDRREKKALRMALQTREQHIKREKATSNICTSQVLMAILSSMYAVYHGSEGLKEIAQHIHSATVTLAGRIEELGYIQLNKIYFDTLHIQLNNDVTSTIIKEIALSKEINLRYINDEAVGISIDETITANDINNITEIFAIARKKQYRKIESIEPQLIITGVFERKSAFLTAPVFNIYHSETGLMRYIRKLEKKDISLTDSMIALGSCTMKLNAAAELIPLTWSEFGEIHPFVPINQTEGYQILFYELGNILKEITGFEGISFQPNSGAAGEYTGLMIIREYHRHRNQQHRNVALIPSSAHGTNPASAVMAGMQVVIVNCDKNGNIDIDDLKTKAIEHKDMLSCFMVTYPSTHGVFESRIKEMNEIIHENGGQVYMDGANMNAQVGYTNPKTIGADVCHLNLHKTFASPHGGGGPGAGPVCVAEHLMEFLPTHSVVPTGGINGIGAVAAAPWGSALLLTIAHAYCKLLGKAGLQESTKYAILNANYLAASLNDSFPVLYKGESGFVAHEMIIDCRQFKQTADITEIDIAKRLMDYGFHSPTVSFPVHGTLMVEPTESEPLQELNRFIEAIISIKNEIDEIASGIADKTDNVLKNAPHTAEEVVSDNWSHPYSREKAVYPLPWIRENKYWPTVSRINDAYGDRNLICSCNEL